MKVKVNLKSREVLPVYSDEQKTWLAKRVGLTLEQLKTLHDAAQACYQYIGHDLAEANEGKLMKRRDLIEVVLDANHIEHTEYARRFLTADLKNWLSRKATLYPLDHIYEAFGPAFPFPEYE